MRTKLPDMTPILLPKPQRWNEYEEVEEYAARCINILGLDGWSFVWDKTICRLGCCKPAKKTVSLSIFFVIKYIGSDPKQIWQTLLHELAHALAWEFNRTHGHGATWHCFCAKLGIPSEKSKTKCENFAPPERVRTPKFVLCHEGTGEIYHYYTTTPRSALRKIKTLYIRGRMEETLGKLMIRPFNPYTDKPQ